VSAEGDDKVRRLRRLPRWLRVTLGLLLLALLVAAAILWVRRVELATDYIDRELARRGVHASYQVKRIGFGSQIFENLVIGDPRRPDLTARHVEVGILIGLTGPRVGLITARGVRMYGRVEGGRLRLGEIDRLLPAPTGEPFRLPDQAIDVGDAALALATPAGDVAVALSGSGNLADGFRGGLAIVAPRLRFGDCVLTRPVARLVVRVKDEKPRIRGPAAIASVICGNRLAVQRPLFLLKGVLTPGLDGWRGASALRTAALEAGGRRLAAVQGHFTFSGNAKETVGGLDLRSGALADPAFAAAHTRFAGRYALAPRRGALALDGQAGADGLVLRNANAIAAALRGARGTPIGPIGDALAEAVLRAGRDGADGTAILALTHAGDSGVLQLGAVDVRSRSGAHLSAGGGAAIAYAWPAGTLRFDRDFSLSGGGFPDARFMITRGASGIIAGGGRIAPFAAGGARLALGEIGFALAPDGRGRFRTAVTLDGPVGAGRITGLGAPLAGRFGRGGFGLDPACVAAGFQAFDLQRLHLTPARFTLCPGRRGAELRAPRFAGRLGASPVTLAAERVDADARGFTATRLAIRLRAASGVSRLDIAALDGRFGSSGAGGHFTGLAGDLAAVPLLVSDGGGAWGFAGSALDLRGHFALADRQAPARFHPLASDDLRLALAGNRLHAVATLIHPASHSRIALATIDHDLGSGAGQARLEVRDLRFAPHGLQPDALTPLTVGIVALVDGSVSGEGRILWDAEGVRSTGRFATAGMNLAAPFGPVQGLTTSIAFTDLLGLVSAPGQEARIRLIQPGIDVYDGVVRYQLRPDYHVAVESARWPLAGGILTLEPAILDFSQDSVKALTFRVEALDAARFIQQLEFSNIAATGTYDGTIPMLFDHNGGRIVGGRLVARADGGTLSYVGELSDRDLGTYGVLAFDALKSLRYSRMEISLDGALDGEFLTRVDMDGVARNPAGTREPGGGVSGMVVGRVLHQLARIPFHFNIRISGRFRALVATARSFQDPRDLIRASLPQLLRNRTPPPVQPHESEPMR
jgi:translocation and assembly module TamB